MSIEKRKRRKYDLEFKKDAVQHYLNSGRSYQEVAENLGISDHNLMRWVQLFKSDPKNKADVSVYEENKRLRKELAEVRMERDILKKATAIFAKTK